MRLAVVDDQALVLQGISELLEAVEDFEVSLRASSGEELLGRLEETEVDVVVMDVRMPGRSGPDTVRALEARERPPPVLLLTTFDDEALFAAAIDCGARGFMLKDADIGELERALRRIAAGGSYLAPVTGTRFRLDPSEPPAPPPPRLSDRELDVLRLMAGGYSNREIAGMLFLAEGTVKNHVSVILHKLKTRDRTRAVLRALGQGLV